MVNGSTDDPEVVHLVSKDEIGGARAAAYLHSLGHRKFFILAGPQEHRSHNLRLQGFREELRRLNVEESHIHVVPAMESDFDQGYTLMAKHLSTFIGEAYSVLFTTNDMLALGAMKVMLQNAIRIPEQAAVMGFDDIDFAAAYSPSLTTVKVDTTRMGRDAVVLLDRLISRNQDMSKLYEYASEIIIRQST